jgi:acetoin utilization deacetylase AcuC-like enzyme
MKVFYSDHFVLPLPEGHRFPTVKYSMLRERVARDRICDPGELLTPRAVTDEEILRAHAPDYMKRVASGTLTKKEVRRIGFPWSERMVERSRRASGGTLGACLDAADADLAIYLAGADPFEGDRLGRLSVTKSGLAERDRIVLEA